ncbi:hypothetical protein ACROYT_G015563 [Oculina patagonica]
MLKEVKRQEDAAFVNMLNKVRSGIVVEEVTRVLSSRVVGDDEIDLQACCFFDASHYENSVRATYMQCSLQPTTWTEHTVSVEQEAKEIMESELEKSTWEAKLAAREFPKQDSDEELEEKVVKVGMILDCLWSSCGWSACDGVVTAISVHTGKVVDIVHLSSCCAECKKMDQRHTDGEISRKQFLEWF